MRRIRKTVRRGIAFYRTHGFRAFVKAAFIYLLNGYRHQLKRYQLFPSLKPKATGRARRILYIDYFSLENDNFYWLKAFRKLGTVKAFDIVREGRASLTERILDFKPVHIHLGGSVKNNAVPPHLLSEVKKKLNCTISVFYGDAKYSPYHCELAKVVDCIYVASKTHIKINQEKGYDNFQYMPCPTDPEIFNHKKCRKIYDLVFIGNYNEATASRLPLLTTLADNFNLKVFGHGWEKTGLSYGSPIYGKKFSRVCSQAKICLSIVAPEWANLEAYFSIRLVNTLATGSFCIETYTPGLEEIFTNREHLVWYTTEEELFELVEYYLANEAEREKIAAEGQKEVCQRYSFEKSVERILQNIEITKDSSLTKPELTYERLDEEWQDALIGEVAKGGKRFTLNWYKDHPITRELLDSGILGGHVVELGCGIGTRACWAQEVSGARITAIDGSQYAINRAADNFKSPKLNFLCGDLLRMPVKSGTFDNAYMLEVIEHIVDTNALLCEIRRVIKPGGKLFLSVTEKNYHGSPDHVHVFTKKKLKDALGEFRILNLYVKERIIFATVEVQPLSRQIQGAIKRAAASYTRHGFRGFVRVASVFLLEKWRILRFVKARVRRHRGHRLLRQKPLRLHLGCGSIHLDDYVNIDIEDWAGACDLVANATKLCMVDDNSVDHIFTHALLEHIPPWDTMRTLSEWHRVLKPGGTIQIEVPDLERVFGDWLVHRTLDEQEAINNIYGGFKSPDKAYRHQDHLTGFTYERLTRTMADCGFTDFGRLEHPKYHHVLVVQAQKGA